MKKIFNLVLATFLFVLSLFSNSVVKAENYLLNENPNGNLIGANDYLGDVSSGYTVEFTYNNKQYVLQGDSSVELLDILKKLGLTGEILNVEVSNNDLLSIVKEGDKWIVYSKKSFFSTEWVKVTLDDHVYEITLTDATIIEEGLFGNAGWGGGNNKIWWGFDSDGVLTIRPLSSANNAGGAYLSKYYDITGRSDKTQYANTVYQWPWQKYRDSITKIVITGKIYTDGTMKLNKMFANYPLLVEVSIKSKTDTENGLELVTLDGQQNQSFFSRVTEADEMFANCPKLEKVDISGFRNNGVLWSMKRMFSNNPNLKTVILNNSGFKTRASDSNGVMMQGFFYGSDNLEYVDLSNITIGGRKQVTQYSNGVKGYDFPDGEYSNLTKRYSSSGINYTSWSDYTGFDNLFLNKINLHTVKLINTKVSGMKGFASMFENCASLKAWDGEKGLDLTGFKPSDATDMRNMFKNCSLLDKLDVSSFGVLNNIVNMDGFIEGCVNLEILNIDNLDNSNIGPFSVNHILVEPTSNNYPINIYSNLPGFPEIVTKVDSMKTGAAEYGREIFGKKVYDIPSSFPKLVSISANNSKVWLVKNNRGTPGNEYFTASSDSEVLYLFKTKTTLTVSDEISVEIDSKRDYIDLIIDRDGVNKHTVNPVADSLPDANENLNMKYDLNKNGAGFLTPGVYDITTTAWEDEKIDLPETYYRIAYLGEVPFKIEGIDPVTSGEAGSDPDLVLIKTENNAWLNTKTKTNWPTSGSYTIDRTSNPIKITYEDVAIDANGKKHNVIITIKKITFTNLEMIPTYAGNERIHNSNRYIDFHPTNSSNANNQSEWSTYNTGYYRPILQATKADGLTFRNYIRVGDGNIRPGSTNDWQVLSGGSGTNIDFTVEVEGANPNTSFVFHGDDIDVTANQLWTYPNDDADYDYLTVDSAVYGIGGEGFILGDGNDLDSITFAKHTGLKLINDNTIITTGSDPNTTWSRFIVKADAEGSDYTWTSGTSCSTYALRNTDKIALGEIEIQPISKILLGGTLLKDQFEFVLTPDDTVQGNMATGSAITVKNDESGYVNFDVFKFASPSVEIDGKNYYPGTVNDTTNTHGQGSHISYTYAWTIQEKDGSDTNVMYDLTPRKLKVVINTPENDVEMVKGIKASIYVDDALVKTVWSKEVKDDKHLNLIEFKNILVKTITVKKTWQDKNNLFDLRPNNLNAYIKYQSGNQESVQLNITSWDKTKDSEGYWTSQITIPANAKIIEYDEKNLPSMYEQLSKKIDNDNKIYEITNKLKTYDITLSKEVIGKKGDQNKEFEFTIKIKDLDGNTIEKELLYTNNAGKEIKVSSSSSGFKTNLKHNEKIVIKSIPVGFTYEIIETNGDYTVHNEVLKTDNNEEISKKKKSNTVEGTLNENHTVNFTNELERYDITLTKKVIGKKSDTNKEFEFNITIKDMENKIFKDEITYLNNNGEEVKVVSSESGFKVKLKHNEKIVIKSIPVGFTYEIIETNGDYIAHNEVLKTDNNEEISSNKESNQIKVVIEDDQTVIFTNELKCYDITLNAKVSGTKINYNKEFTFKIIIRDTDGNIVDDEITYENKDGELVSESHNNEGISVKLKHNEKVVIKSIPVGYTYEVIQVNDDYNSYNEVFNTDTNEELLEKNESKKVKLMLTGNHTINFISEKIEVVKSGLFVDIWPFLLLVIISISMLFVFRKMSKYN